MSDREPFLEAIRLTGPRAVRGFEPGPYVFLFAHGAVDTPGIAHRVADVRPPRPVIS